MLRKAIGILSKLAAAVAHYVLQQLKQRRGSKKGKRKKEELSIDAGVR